MRHLSWFFFALTLVITCLILEVFALPNNSTTNLSPSNKTSTSAKGDNCDSCGPTRLIGCRQGRCYYKCIRRCLGKDNKFYYEALKFNFAGQ